MTRTLCGWSCARVARCVGSAPAFCGLRKVWRRPRGVIGQCCYVVYVCVRQRSRPASMPLLPVTGAYMTACAFQYAKCCGDEQQSALGLFSGIFFGIFQLTQVSGNLIESLVYKSGESPVPLFTVYLVCAAAGTLLSAFLRKVEDVSGPDESAPLLDAEHGEGLPAGKMAASTSSINVDGSATKPAADPSQETLVQLLMRTAALWTNPKMVLLIPMLFYSGLEQGWVFSAFTTSFIKPSLSATNIGFVMTAFGAADALGSFALGKLSDVVGRPPVLIVGFLLQGSVAVVLLNVTLGEDAWAPLILCAVAWGIGDAAWNTQISGAWVRADGPAVELGGLTRVPWSAYLQRCWVSCSPLSWRPRLPISSCGRACSWASHLC